MSDSKEIKMNKIIVAVTNLKESPLYAYRIEHKYVPVIGEGGYNASIMFVGEAPGKKEAETGKPFCGASGKILDQLLNHVGINRKEVYVTSIVKDRPINNRDPKSNEILLYAPFLISQIEIIKPKVIATLGRYSMKFILEHYKLEKEVDTITKVHGTIFTVTVPWGEMKIIPLFHPAVAVYNRNQLIQLQKDMEILKNIL